MAVEALLVLVEMALILKWNSDINLKKKKEHPDQKSL